jgi:hypothetical protein
MILFRLLRSVASLCFSALRFMSFAKRCAGRISVWQAAQSTRGGAFHRCSCRSIRPLLVGRTAYRLTPLLWPFTMESRGRPASSSRGGILSSLPARTLLFILNPSTVIAATSSEPAGFEHIEEPQGSLFQWPLHSWCAARLPGECRRDGPDTCRA